jgi:hypothetical protein
MTALVWIAVALMVIGAVMLIVGVGAPGLWIAVVTVGIVGRHRPKSTPSQTGFVGPGAFPRD